MFLATWLEDGGVSRGTQAIRYRGLTENCFPCGVKLFSLDVMWYFWVSALSCMGRVSLVVAKLQECNTRATAQERNICLQRLWRLQSLSFPDFLSCYPARFGFLSLCQWHVHKHADDLQMHLGPALKYSVAACVLSHTPCTSWIIYKTGVVVSNPEWGSQS